MALPFKNGAYGDLYSMKYIYGKRTDMFGWLKIWLPQTLPTVFATNLTKSYAGT